MIINKINHLNPSLRAKGEKLASLSDAVWRLQDQVNGDADLYTPALNEAIGKVWDQIHRQQIKASPEYQAEQDELWGAK